MFNINTDNTKTYKIQNNLMYVSDINEDNIKTFEISNNITDMENDSIDDLYSSAVLDDSDIINPLAYHKNIKNEEISSLPLNITILQPRTDLFDTIKNNDIDECGIYDSYYNAIGIYKSNDKIFIKCIEFDASDRISEEEHYENTIKYYKDEIRFNIQSDLLLGVIANIGINMNNRHIANFDFIKNKKMKFTLGKDKYKIKSIQINSIYFIYIQIKINKTKLKFQMIYDTYIDYLMDEIEIVGSLDSSNQILEKPHFESLNSAKLIKTKQASNEILEKMSCNSFEYRFIDIKIYELE
jgi:hypothetical protein